MPAGDFAFAVHSAFRAALNLCVPGRRSLVTLLAPDAEDQPNAVRLAGPVRFDEWPVAPGDSGRREGDRIVFDGPPGEGVTSVDLAPATHTRERSLAPLAPGDPAWRASWRACARALEALQAAAGTELRLAEVLGTVAASSAIGRRMASAARDLEDGIRAVNAASAARAASRILGLGGGLTPAGDDFLCGLGAALHCTSAGHGTDAEFLRAWGEDVSSRLDATNAVSATFLECAIAGSFGAAMCDWTWEMARGVTGGTSPGLAAAMGRVCAMGHSSGTDTATGFLFGLAVRNDPEMRRYAASI